ncbi:MAG: hypothetical protein KatS3mg090_0511 [Patescibacteria group bacterium]|nr:MAG: hypothetical protein KatS3mg090_0511 [Patescibacteria group bacterium]
MSTEKQRVLEWLFSFLLGFNLFFFCLLYLTLNKQNINIYLINKALANTALLLIVVVLFIGPLSRIYNWPDILVAFRKEIGITAFLFGMAHTILSLLPQYYSLRFYFSKFNPSFYSAVIAIIILTILFVLSFEKIISNLPRKLWWQIQYMGVRTAFIFIIIHFLLKNISKWQNWLTAKDTLPDLNLLIFLLCIFLIIFRITEYLNRKLSIAVFTVGSLILLGSYIFLLLY